MPEVEKIRILAVAGPTASGKTALSIALAKHLGGEIVACDSMQVYRGMDIGTAKPTPEEQREVPHHLIDVTDPSCPFSAADYVALAGEAIKEIHARKKLPILCGGTGLYLDSLLRGGFEETRSDPALRDELFAFVEENGAHALHDRLRAVDPAAADAIHERNVGRVVRALEIYLTTGITKTESDLRSRSLPSPYRAVVIGLCDPGRTVLYRRIEERVGLMLRSGLWDEVRRLRDAGVFSQNATAAQAIGYKEALAFLRGEGTEADAKARIVLATRHYAKRQMTWFRAKPYVNWVPFTDGERLRSQEVLLQDVLQVAAQAADPDAKEGEV